LFIALFFIIIKRIVCHELVLPEHMVSMGVLRYIIYVNNIWVFKSSWCYFRFWVILNLQIWEINSMSLNWVMDCISLHQCMWLYGRKYIKDNVWTCD